MQINRLTSEHMSKFIVVFLFITSIFAQLGYAQQTTYKKHLVAQGETLYSLAKLYNLSVDELYKANPDLDSLKMRAGIYIQIPVPEVSKTHVVQKKETLYSIAQLYACTVNDLLRVNPEISLQDKLKKGFVLKIPAKVVSPASTTVITPTVKTPIPAPQVQENKIRIAIVMPFKTGNSTSERAVEFYQGVLLAIDSLRKNDKKTIEVYAYESGQSEVDIQNVLKQTTLKQAQLIFGPVFASQIPVLSDYAKRNEIPLVIPFSSKCYDWETNPYVYLVNTPENIQGQIVYSEYAKLFKHAHTVFIESSTKNPVNFITRFENFLLKKGLSYNRSPYISTEEDLLSVFSKEKINVVIPSGMDINSLNVLIPQLKTFLRKHPEYTIRLFGYPEWQTYTGSQLENFHLFDTYIYSPFYRNPLDRNATSFDKLYEANFNKPMISTYPRIAMFGYDCGGYFVKMLQQYGKNVDNKKISILPVQSAFSFNRPNKGSGLVNTGLYFINYKTDHTIAKYIVE